jgi:cystatin-A/B
MPGGLSAPRPADAEVQSLCEQLKPELEGKVGKTFNVFTALEVGTQVVAGTNYFVKIHVGDDECMHVRIHKPLPHTGDPASLHSYQAAKSKHDELQYF